MAITLKELKFTEVKTTCSKKVWTFTQDVTITATYTKGNDKYQLTLACKKNFRTDGASVPSAFVWFLPKWNDKNMTYNMGAALHDCLYSSKGVNGTFSREECDDFFRGAVRCAGYSRFKAGVADKAIEWFAKSPKHWGDDDLDNVKNNLFTFSIKKIS